MMFLKSCEEIILRRKEKKGLSDPLKKYVSHEIMIKNPPIQQNDKYW